jgi:zinc protease
VIKGVPGKKVVEDVARAPQDSEEVAIVASNAPSEAWRGEPPKPSLASKLVLPIPVTFKLANGLKVFLLERHNLPVVAAHLVSIGGESANPVEKPGLSWFTADMLDEGTKNRSTLQIAEDLDQNGTSLSTGSGQDADWASMHCLTKTADASFDILSDVLLHPAFQAKEIDRVRNELVTSLQQDKDQPVKIARRVLNRELYGADNPWGYDEREQLRPPSPHRGKICSLSGKPTLYQGTWLWLWLEI